MLNAKDWKDPLITKQTCLRLKILTSLYTISLLL